MVTIDDTVRNVGIFDDDLITGRRDYERAKQGSELIAEESSQLEEALKAYTGFDDFNLPSESTETTIRRGDVRFVIVSEARTKRPAYKTAVEGMDNYLGGISFLLSQGIDISGVFRRGKLSFIGVDRLLEAFHIIVGGIFTPEVKHTIRYEVFGALADEKPLDEIVLRADRRPGALTEENFANYVRMDRIKQALLVYVESYEKELTKGQRKPEKTTAVTTRTAYETTKSKSEGPDWTYVVKTLVTVPTDPKSLGELNILNDQAISKAEKERKFPYYTLTYRTEQDTRVLYVSIQSIALRIEDLKEGPSIEAKRLQVRPKEIV